MFIIPVLFFLFLIGTIIYYMLKYPNGYKAWPSTYGKELNEQEEGN